MERCSQHLLRLAATIENADVSEWSEHVLVMKKNELDRVWSKYQLVKDAIYANDNGADALAELDQKAIENADRYGLSKDKMDSRARVLNLFATGPTLKPSEIVLPTFSGDYTAWTAWRSEFVNKVKDTALPVDAKIDILFRSLNGDARLRAGDTERRDLEDFDRIWARLEERYDNKYQIIFEHIMTLFNLPIMNKSSPTTIRFLIDSVDQELRSLRRFGYDTESWSPMMAVLLIMRMDQNTRTIWEMEHTPNDPPDLETVHKFLEKRLMAVRNLSLADTVLTPSRSAMEEGHASRSNPSVSHANPFKRGQLFGKSSKGHHDRAHPYVKPQPLKNSVFTCPYCNAPHFLWFCRQFKSWDLPKRIKKVGEWGLCPCCLLAKHPAAACSVTGCPRCENAKHNNMLCPKSIVFKLPSAVAVPRGDASGSHGAGRNNYK